MNPMLTFHATDGTYRLCAVTALPLLDEHGHLLKWQGTIVDVHGRLPPSRFRFPAVPESVTDAHPR